MPRRIVVLTILAFFVLGVMSAMAGEQGCKNVTQSIYDWFGGMDKTDLKNTNNCCKTCGCKCCATCKSDCGGKCCSSCTKS